MNGTVNPLSITDLRNIAKKFGVESHAKMSTKVIIKRTFGELGWGHVKPLFATKLIAYNTSLLILIYAVIGLAYPLFNGFLGIYLTNIPSSTPNEAYAGYAIQAACGVPGSILAAALVEWKVKGKWSFVAGRRGAMAFASESDSPRLARPPASQVADLPRSPLLQPSRLEPSCLPSLPSRLELR